MKTKFPFLLLITFIIISCHNQKKKSVEETVQSSDTTCINEIQAAKVDINNKILVYCNYVGNIVWEPLRAEKEMRGLLKVYNIEYKDESSPCVIQFNKNYHCYCEFMEERINEKYGEKFIDSLLFVSDSLYILKHLTDTFDNSSTSKSWDKPVMFPGDSTYDRSNHSGLQKEFEKLVKYPKDYRIKKGKDSMAMLQVYLDIDEKGKAIVTNTQFIFFDSRTKEDDYNKEYWNYFRSIAVPLVENTIWTPAKIKSISVKSKNDIFIYLE